MLIQRASDIRSSEITDRKVYYNRREFIRAAGVTAAAVAAGVTGGEAMLEAAQPAAHGRKLENVKSSPFSTSEKLNTWEQITTYNNYYEFGVDKDQPSMLSRNFDTANWTVAVEGECNKKAVWHLEDILKGQTLEDRIYRHRCVEGWSMVIPWVGFPLADFIKKCEPTSKAKYVEFVTAVPAEADARDARAGPAVALRRRAADGRSDAPAHHSRRRALRRGPAESGRRAAPPRRPVEVRLQARQVDREDPVHREAADEHVAAAGAERIRLLREREPERRSPALEPGDGAAAPSLFKNCKTQMFNGYADQVASLYAGMDLRRNF